MTPDFTLTRDDKGRLVLARPGQDDVADVRIRRAFPWSSAAMWISIRSSEGKELLMVEDPAALPPEPRAALQQALAQSSFIPVIRRIDQIDMRFGPQEWRVQTDRGEASFRVQEREDIRFLNDGRFSVKDADGNLYELPPLDQLDAESRHRLEQLL